MRPVALLPKRSGAVVVAAASAIWALAPLLVQAAGGYSFMLPAGTGNPSGLSLKIEDRGIDANGYRPIEVEIAPRPLKPLVADREVRVVLEFSRYGWQSTATVSQVIELPEGTTGVKAVMLVPQGGAYRGLSVSTYEGGHKHRDLSQNYVGWPALNGWSWTEARPAMLFIDSHVPDRAARELAIQNLNHGVTNTSGRDQLPDVRTLLSHFPDVSQRGGPPLPPPAVQNVQTPQISDAALLALIKSRTRSEMLGLAELPTRWLELSQYDVAFISLDDLQRLASGEPTRFAALGDWVSTGPLLVVYGVGRDFERLEELEKLLQLSRLPPSEKQPHLLGWTAPQSGHDIGTLTTPFDDASDFTTVDAGGTLVTPVSPEPAAENDQKKQETTESQASERLPFVFRRAHLGCVAAIAEEQPFPGKARDWAYLFNAVPDSHWKWFRRTGFSSQRTNDDYWKFLIPGVGEAPVVPFMVLVSLFAVVIGPVNFLLLKRWRRLYLLLLTVPAGAAVVTASLILFALFSDGFAVRLRVRSFTDLDQRSGQAAIWSRQSYYAGLAPSQGLVFPEDTLVLPLVYEPGASTSDRSTVLHWDGEQQLQRGYLAARTATQFMVARAAKTDARVVVTEAGVGQPPRVENRLGTRVQYLVVRTSDGVLYATEDVANKTGKVLAATDLAATVEAMRPLTEAGEPVAPYDYDPTQLDDDLFMLVGRGRTRHYSSDGSTGDPLMSRSILETNLNACVRPISEIPLSPTSYLAIVERSPVAVIGLPRAREEASLHVIRGAY